MEKFKSPWLASNPAIDVLNLYHSIDTTLRKNPLSFSDLKLWVLQAIETDKNLEACSEQPSGGWEFKVVEEATAETDIVSRRKYHVYYDVWVAKVWNGIRGCRIFANQINCGLLESPVAGLDSCHFVGRCKEDVLRQARNTLVNLRDDLLASVPQMMGYTQPHMAHGSFVSTPSDRQVPSAGGLFLFWFLALAGSLRFNSSRTQAEIKAWLETIANSVGIQMANAFAMSLPRGV